MSGHVVVDGSNIATEGRSFPSLVQLDEAVRAFIAEHPHDVVTVVVDASFGHRIDESEQQAFEEARGAGELVMPPAGAIGRGDGFLLQIADKADATVLSNDSFQEFHGQYEWLFDQGRLVGGTPVPGVGWIFSMRTPVRGPRSREAVRRTKKVPATTEAPAPARARGRAKKSAAKASAAKASAAKSGAVKRAAKVVVVAEPAPTDEAGGENGGRRRRRRRKGKGPTEPVNDPAVFVTFVAEHLPGTEVEGEVEQFASHGAYVTAGGARCYVPLTGLADPPPRRARDALRLGETRAFVVRAIDTPRRGIELALPGVAPVPQPDAELDAVLGADDRPRRAKQTAAKTTKKKAAAEKTAPKKTTTAKTATSKTATAKKKAAPKKTTTAKQTAAKTTKKKAAAEKTVPKKTTTAKTATTKTAAKKKAAPKVTTAKKTAAKTTKKAAKKAR
jgi:hypothetical protein